MVNAAEKAKPDTRYEQQWDDYGEEQLAASSRPQPSQYRYRGRGNSFRGRVWSNASRGRGHQQGSGGVFQNYSDYSGAGVSSESNRQGNAEMGRGGNFSQPPQFQNQSYNPQTCNKCGRFHAIGACFAFNKECFRCRKVGHFSFCCRSPPVYRGNAW